MKLRPRSLAPLAIALLASVPRAGADAEADAVLRQAVLFGGSSTLALKVAMEIVLPNGTKTRDLEIYVKRDGAAYRVRAQVASPAFLREMKLLWYREANGSRATWLKTSQGVRQIGSEGGGERLFDSDFTVEDLTEVETADFELRLAGTRDVDGRSCRVVNATATRTRRTGGYARKVVLVDRVSMLVRGVEYYDGAGSLTKRYRVVATQRAGGVEVPREAIMEDLGKGSSTTLRFTSVEAGTALPDRLFSRAGL